jgi:hypothetical protein
MKTILAPLLLILISPMSYADWGDVYYCQMTNLSAISLEGKKSNYKLEKFQFRLDKTKNAMVFGSSGFFGGMEYGLVEWESWPASEEWYANHTYSRAYFKAGKFLDVLTGSEGSRSISADCDKF